LLLEVERHITIRRPLRQRIPAIANLRIGSPYQHKNTFLYDLRGSRRRGAEPARKAFLFLERKWLLAAARAEGGTDFAIKKPEFSRFFLHFGEIQLSWVNIFCSGFSP
jgi:hypothetical protein